jgi:hypothetical protein
MVFSIRRGSPVETTLGTEIGSKRKSPPLEGSSGGLRECEDGEVLFA